MKRPIHQSCPLIKQRKREQLLCLLLFVFSMVLEEGQDNSIKRNKRALTGVAQWVGCQPANWKVTSSIPDQGRHIWVAGQVLSWGHVRGNLFMLLSYTHVSLSSLPSSPSLKINKIFKKKKEIKGIKIWRKEIKSFSQTL